MFTIEYFCLWFINMHISHEYISKLANCQQRARCVEEAWNVWRGVVVVRKMRRIGRRQVLSVLVVHCRAGHLCVCVCVCVCVVCDTNSTDRAVLWSQTHRCSWIHVTLTCRQHTFRRSNMARQRTCLHPTLTRHSVHYSSSRSTWLHLQHIQCNTFVRRLCWLLFYTYQLITIKLSKRITCFCASAIRWPNT